MNPGVTADSTFSSGYSDIRPIFGEYYGDPKREEWTGAADPNRPDWYAEYMVAEEAETELFNESV
ncbi:hypothetical protein KO481_10425 [Nocardia sp. NEAU-G5]|uniref:Uncharacterized protein n=1 Tax=Nocardia albiluteola TaxID=2842303 RepID=A0ABS6AV83_9NOCA|nr:hypothetical protein [Nocardia albiluteola]MBU3061939.1 hypothetical protein [Nocardia albiluteola]